MSLTCWRGIHVAIAQAWRLSAASRYRRGLVPVRFLTVMVLLAALGPMRDAAAQRRGDGAPPVPVQEEGGLVVSIPDPGLQPAVPVGEGASTEGTVSTPGSPAAPGGNVTVPGGTTMLPIVGTIIGSLPSALAAPKAVATSGGKLSVIAGRSGAALAEIRWDGRSWQPATRVWTDLGGVTDGRDHACATLGALVHVFARRSDGAIWNRASRDGVWATPWRSLGGSAGGEPVTVVTSGGRIELFARDSLGQVIHHSVDTSSAATAASWTSLRGAITGRPAAVADGGGAVIFARGTDGAVWSRRWSGAAEPADAAGDEWESLGGAIADSPVALRMVNGTIAVLGRGTDDAVWMRSWRSRQVPAAAPGNALVAMKGSDAWTSLGGSVIGEPVVLASPGGLDVFAIGKDRAVWTVSLKGGDPRAASGWTSLGGDVSGALSVAVRSPAVIDLVARGADRGVWHLAFEGRWSAWEALGDGSVLAGSDDPSRCRVRLAKPRVLQFDCPSGASGNLAGMGPGDVAVTVVGKEGVRTGVITSKAGSGFGFQAIDRRADCASGHVYCGYLACLNTSRYPDRCAEPPPRCPPNRDPDRDTYSESCNIGGAASFDFCGTVSGACGDDLFGTWSSGARSAACAAAAFCN